jgi:hypothetical protein
MKSLAFGAEHMTMREYIEGTVANIARGLRNSFQTGRGNGRGAGCVVLAADARRGVCAATL